jgi:hypothetical protein
MLIMQDERRPERGQWGPTGPLALLSDVEQIVDYINRLEQERPVVLGDPGQPATATVHFTGTATAGMTITLSMPDIFVPGEVEGETEDEEVAAPTAPDPVAWVYAEVDTPDATLGQWTNGASAAQSAASFADAVNEDSREDEEAGTTTPSVGAVVLANGVSVLVYARSCGELEGTISVASSSGTVLVEDLGQCHAPGFGPCRMLYHDVTARDVDAGEVSFLVLKDPDGRFAFMPVRDVNGTLKTTQPTGALSFQDDPPRLRYLFGGATNPVAGDQMRVVVQE